MSATITVDNRRCTPVEATRIADKYQNSGQLGQAAEIYRDVLKLFPQHAEAHLGLGYAEVAMGNWQEGLYHAHEAQKANPKILKIYHLALLAMHKRVAFKTLTSWCDRGLEHFPNDPHLLYQKAHIASLDRNREETLNFTSRTIANLDDKDTQLAGMALALIGYVVPSAEWDTTFASIKTTHLHTLTQVSFNVRRLIGMWLSNAAKEDIRKLHTTTQKMFQSLGDTIAYQSEREREHLSIAINTNTAYMKMISELQTLPSPTETDIAADTPILYIVGESHTVPAHRQRVTWHGQTYQTQSHLCMGAKLWHLISPTTTFQTRETIIDILKSLPPEAPIMFQIGEIDCRATEGLMRAQHTSGKPLDQLVEDTVTGAVAWLAEHAGQRPVIVAGVPAPHPQRDMKVFANRKQHEAYGEMIHHLNRKLKECTHHYGWDFLDLYSLTVAPNSFLSTAEWHLELTHLKPEATQAAFERHLVPPQKQ